MNKLQAPAHGMLGKLYFLLLPFLLFFATTAISRQFAVGLAALCLILMIGREPMALLRPRISPLAGSVILYAFLCLLSGLWSHFGAYAAQESAKILIALSIFGLVLCRTQADHLRHLLWSLNGVLAAISLLCVDAACWQLFSRGFSAFMKLFSSNYPLERMGYETGVRITGIFSNANVSAGMIAFGLILSLYLYQTASSNRERLAGAWVLGLEALAFFLSFSMGAMAAFALTCVVYVLCMGRGNRLSSALLMAECVVATLLCAFVAYPFLGSKNPLPVLLAAVCGLLIWALDRFLGQKLLVKLDAKGGKTAGVTVGVLAVLALCYGLLAMQITGSYTLRSEETLSRAVYPSAGTYTVSVEGADAHAVIYSQNQAELMMHTQTPLYEGPLSDASFAVPEDSKVVWFELTGDGTLERVSLSDGTRLPLGYRLLPGFAANRLQGLSANQNFIQRLVFFQDGWKLFQKSPLLGWGVGGVEGQLTSVQSFYYESKYIHNQFIQIMDEAGIPGLLALLLILGNAVLLLVRRRKEPREPLFAMFAASLTMMIAHSLTEVVWSTQMYQVVIFTLLAALIIQYHRPVEKRHMLALSRTMAAGLLCPILIFSALQFSSLLAARTFERLDRSLSKGEILSTFKRLELMDVYDDTSYQANLMANYLQAGNTIGRGTAAKYAGKLMDKQEFDACYNVAAYYYLPLRDFDGFFETLKVGILQEGSNPAAWDSALHLIAQAAAQVEGDDLLALVSKTVELGDFMTTFNEGRMQPIVLDDGNQALLSCMETLVRDQADAQTAAASLQAVLPA